MTLQIELTWLLGAILTINTAAAGFLWRQIEALRKEESARAEAAAKAQEKWQADWTEILNRHMDAEEHEFNRIRNLQLAFATFTEKAQHYVSREDLDQALAPLREKIDKIERIVDSRRHPRPDSVIEPS